MEPAGSREQEALAQAGCAAAQLGGQRGEHFELGGRQHGPKSKLRRRTLEPGEEEGLRLILVEAGEPGPVAIDELVAARRSPLRVDRHPRRRQAVEITVHGPQRHLELVGEFARRHPTPRLEEQEDGDQAARLHE